jgi:hypothetical protein
MRKYNNILKKLSLIAFAFMYLLGCSEDYLEVNPTGTLSPNVLATTEGLDALLLAAYAGLDGHTGGVTNLGWQNDHTNWLYGEVASDNALKGSSIGDQPDMNLVEQGQMSPDNPYMDALWGSIYEGITRSNSVLQTLSIAENLSDVDQKRIAGEARFLRGHYHHYGRRYFNRIPYIDETVTDFRVPNDRDIFSDIEADYKFAIENLPIDPTQVGRAHISAAQASLAKLYMDEGDFANAKPLLDAIINSGRYRLFDNYNDNFVMDNEKALTNTEFIFQIQSLSRQGELNGRLVNGIAQLHGCCGFLQPSQNLVNAHKTDENGLPLLDSYNEMDLGNDQGIETTDAFTPPTDNLDPRLDYTVARRGIPFLDFDINLIPGDANLFPGKDFVVDQVTYGPYRAKKFLPTKVEVESGAFLGVSSINYSVHRYADILLLRAEVAVEENDLGTALDMVNQIRNRAKNGEVIRFADGIPSANYVIEPYTSFPNQDFARKAVRFERRLELALEGFRWFDLVRWGIAEETILEYFNTEGRPLLTALGTYTSDYMPIPSNQIDISRDDDGNPTLVQNPGY